MLQAANPFGKRAGQCVVCPNRTRQFDRLAKLRLREGEAPSEPRFAPQTAPRSRFGRSLTLPSDQLGTPFAQPLGMEPDTPMEGTTVVVGIFDDRSQAELAVDDLIQVGFSHGDVGFAIRGHDAVEGGMITDAAGAKDGSGALAGMTAGAVAGGVLGALASLIIPPLGPVLVGGMLATAAEFAGAGMAVGGILGAMTGLGISQDEAVYYEEQFNAGKAIVTVRTGDASADEAVAVIRKHGGFTRRDEIPPDGPTPPTMTYIGT